MIKKFADTKKSKTDNLYSEISDTEVKTNEISSVQNDKNEMTGQQRKDYDHHKLEIEVRDKNVPLKEDDRKKTTVADETAKITAEDIRLKRKQRILDDFRKDDEEYEEFSKLFNKIKKLERIAKEDLEDSEASPKLLTNFSPNLHSTSDHATLTECTAFSRNDIEERNEHRKSPEDRCGNGAGKTEVKFSKYLDGNCSQKKTNQVIDLEPMDTKEYDERGEKLKESRKMETMFNMKTQTEKAKSKKIAEVLKNLTKIQDAIFKDVPSGHLTVSKQGGPQDEERELSKLSKEYLIYLSKKEKSEMTDQERCDYYQFKREHKARKEKKRLLMETMMKLRSAAEKAEKYNPKRNRKTESKMRIQSKRTKLDAVNEDSVHFSKNELCGYQLERSEHERSSKYCCSANEKEDEEIFSKYFDANPSQKDINKVAGFEPKGTKEYVEGEEKSKESHDMETKSDMRTQAKKAKTEKIAEVSKNSPKNQDLGFDGVLTEDSKVPKDRSAQNEERALSKLSKEYLVYLSKKEKSEMTDQERSDYYQFKREHKARKEKKRILMETTLKLRSAAEKVEKFNGKRNREAEPNTEMQSKRTKLHKDKNEMTDQEHRVFNYYKRKLTDRNKDVPLKQVDQKKMKVEDSETSRISAEDLRQKRRQRILDDFRKDDEVYEEFSKVFEQIKKIPRTTKEELKNQPTLPETATELSQNPLGTNDPATLTECTAFSRNDIGAPYKCIYPFLGLFRPIPNVLYGGYESFDDFFKDFGTDMRFKRRMRRQLGTRYRTEEIDAYFEQIRIESELREGWTYRPSTVGVPFGCKKQSSRTAALWKKD